MNKHIDNKKLKVKYLINNFKDLDTYPTHEDILFELIEDFCGRVYTDLKFTDLSLHTKYNISKEFISNFIQFCYDNECIEEVHRTSSYTTYRITKNVFS